MHDIISLLFRWGGDHCYTTCLLIPALKAELMNSGPDWISIAQHRASYITRGGVPHPNPQPAQLAPTHNPPPPPLLHVGWGVCLAIHFKNCC